MIKADQVPYDVVRAAYSAWAGGGGNNVLSAMENAIAAALNAWPGMFSAIRTEEGGVEWDNEGNAPECLVLPLPQEPTND